MANRWGKVERVTDFIFFGSKIIADDDCSHKIKRHLLLGRQVLTNLDQIRSDQSLSHVLLFATPWIAARQASLSITNSRSSLRLTSIESVMPSSHLILCRPLLLLPPIPPSIRVFSNESTLHMRWPKYWTFSFSIIPSKEIPGPISFRMDWLDLLAVQPRQHIKKQRYHFANKGPYSQSCSFSSSHERIWELDHKEGWAPKNWCFWTVVLEKILENSLDSKKIKSVNPKWNQLWIFIGRTDAEAEAPIIWSLDTKIWLVDKGWCWERLRTRGEGGNRRWDGWMASPTQWTWLWANSGRW